MATAPARQLLISATAEADLAEIWAYIAEDSPKAATTFVTALEAKFIPLLDFPGIGSTRDQLAPGLRALPYKTYVIYYTATEAEVDLLNPEDGVSPGQACVFYESDSSRVLGGGWIWRGRV
jgi:tRNA-specific 2-thiouridylase